MRLPKLLAALLFMATTATARTYYIAPNGGDTNGSIETPWSIGIGFDAVWALQPGDTVLIRGGVYPIGYPIFCVRPSGTASAPIIFKPYPGEQPILEIVDQTIDAPAMYIYGSHIWVMGLHIRQPDTDPTTLQRGGISIGGGGNYNKVINCVIENTKGVAIGDQDCYGTEIYGNLVWYPGRSTQGNGGYAVYTQNVDPFYRKTYSDNIFRDACGSYLLHLYGEGGNVDSLTFQNNVILNTFSTGVPITYLRDQGQLNGNHFLDNHFYTKSPVNFKENRASYNSRIIRNTFIGGIASWRDTSNRDFVFESNRYVAPPPVLTWGSSDPGHTVDHVARYPNNEWFTSSQPTQNYTFVKVNKYDKRRANVIVENWLNLTSVSVALPLPMGASYRIVDAQNYFGPPVLEGVTTQANQVVALPMYLTEVSPILPHRDVNGSEPTHSDSKFGVFVVTSNAEFGGSVIPPPVDPPPVVVVYDTLTYTHSVTAPDTAVVVPEKADITGYSYATSTKRLTVRYITSPSPNKTFKYEVKVFPRTQVLLPKGSKIISTAYSNPNVTVRFLSPKP